MANRIRGLFLLTAALALSTNAWAQTAQVGQLTGVVSDPTGSRLPGATVTLTSVERGFTRTTVSETDGRFFFRVVSTGLYDISVSLQGFQTRKVTGNLVEAEKTTNVAIALAVGGVTETTTVTGETPIVDAANQTQMTRLRASELDRLPMGRSYQTIIGSAPGIVGTGNVNAHGALTVSNQFMMDGVVSTDPTTGGFAGNMNYEAIAEVVVRTSGVSAEFGRASGAYVDVITKSGSNQFTGSAKMLVVNDQWDAQNTVRNEVAAADGTFASLARTRFNKVNKTYSFTAGGPIIRDRAWFFGAFEDSRSITPQTSLNPRPGIEAETFQQDRIIQYPNVRGTVQLSPSQNLWVKFASDPFKGIIRNDYWTPYLPAERESLTSQEQGGKIISGQYTVVMGDRWTTEVLMNYKTNRITVEPFERTTLNNGAPFIDLTDNRVYNGATFDGYVTRPRAQVGVATTYYALFGGKSHSLKFGLDYQRQRSENAFRFPANRLYYGSNFDPVNRAFELNDSYEEYEDAPSASKGSLISFYARDSFQPTAKVSVEAGFRVEHQSGTSDVGVPTVSTTDIAPRLSASYSLTSDSRTLVLASYGRYFDGVLQSFSDSFANVPQQENYKTYAWNGTGYDFVSEFKAGANNFSPDTNVTPRHVDEFTVGAERQIGDRLGVSLRYIQREWGNFIDDLREIDQTGALVRSVVNIPNGRRTYKGLEISVDKRLGKNWAASGNYTYGSTRGNHVDNGDNFTLLGDYLGATCRQTADPGLFGGGTFPCSELQTNLYGRPSFDRPHAIKFNGSYLRQIGPFDMVAGIIGSAVSKTTFQQQRTVTVLTPAGANFANVTYFYEPRGSERVSGLLDVYDLNFEIGWRSPRRSAVSLRFETFNLFNNQEKINISNTTWCSSSATAACQTAAAVFGKATARTAFNSPRMYRAQLVYKY